MNHVLTLGFDIAWRKRAARIASRAGSGNWVDVCSGTGEMAVLLKHYAGDNTAVYSVDLSRPMLNEARKKPAAKSVRFVISDIKKLPFPDGSVDLVTISFATRNINMTRQILVQSFAEFHRVLKPGALFINLETSRPGLPLLSYCFDLYVKLLVRPIGTLISGSKAGYTYLANTIPRFYGTDELSGIIREAGFGEVSSNRLLFGIAAIHQAVKR